MGPHPQVAADSGVFEREGSESADKCGLRGLSDDTVLEGDVELRFAGRALQFTSSGLWSDSQLPLTTGAINLDFENLRSQSELACAGATGQFSWALISTCYYDGIAMWAG